MSYILIRCCLTIDKEKYYYASNYMLVSQHGYGFINGYSKGSSLGQWILDAWTYNMKDAAIPLFSKSLTLSDLKKKVP